MDIDLSQRSAEPFFYILMILSPFFAQLDLFVNTSPSHLHLSMSNCDGQIDLYIVKLKILFLQHRPVLNFVCLAVCMAPQMPSRIGIRYLAFFLMVSPYKNK